MTASAEEESREQLHRAVNGDQQALTVLWQTHRRRLKRLVGLRMDRRVRGRVDESDILQDVFIEFAARIKEYAKNPPMPFFLWLRFLTGQRLQQVHRHHLDAKMRDAGREVSITQGMPEASSVTLAAQLLGRFTSVVRSVERAEMQQMMQDAIDELEAIDRDVLALRHFEELSNVEAAKVLGMDASACSSRHVRALKRLRQNLEGKPGFFT